MGDWKDKLAELNKGLQADERAEQERKASVLLGFRKRLLDLEPVVRAATEFGDAFGVDCEWEMTRFDERYPALRFRIKRPALQYAVTCRDGAIQETLREGEGPVTQKQVTLDDLAPRRLEQRVTQWVQAAANSNRKVPGKGKR